MVSKKMVEKDPFLNKYLEEEKGSMMSVIN